MAVRGEYNYYSIKDSFLFNESNRTNNKKTIIVITSCKLQVQRGTITITQSNKISIIDYLHG